MYKNGYILIGVLVGFASANYSVEEMAGSPSLTVTIVREDNLTAVTGFMVMLNLSSSSNATEGNTVYSFIFITIIPKVCNLQCR